MYNIPGQGLTAQKHTQQVSMSIQGLLYMHISYIVTGNQVLRLLWRWNVSLDTGINDWTAFHLQIGYSVIAESFFRVCHYTWHGPTVPRVNMNLSHMHAQNLKGLLMLLFCGFYWLWRHNHVICIILWEPGSPVQYNIYTLINANLSFLWSFWSHSTLLFSCPSFILVKILVIVQSKFKPGVHVMLLSCT